MTSKFQKTPFDTEKLMVMQRIVVHMDFQFDKTVEYKSLKLSIVNGQLCFVTEDGHFAPIARVSTIEDIIAKSNLSWIDEERVD